MAYLVADWEFWARTEQKAPPGDWRVWLFLGGRGAGKTRAGAEWIRAGVEQGQMERVALVAPTIADAREVMIEGPSGLRAIAGEGWAPHYESSRRKLSWPNGAVGYVFSAEDPESLRGAQFDGAWCDEFAIWRQGEYTLAMLEFGLRLGGDPRMVLTTTPKPSAALKAVMAREDLALTVSKTEENAHNLSPNFMAALNRIYGGTRLAAQELNGEIVFDRDDSVWRVDDIIDCPERPVRFDRVVVGVDPPASAGPDADGCGIVAVGCWQGRAYVLEDATVQGLRPQGWAGAATACARRWGAEIVAESNQGGEMVREMLRLADPEIAVRLRQARLSKRARAEPVAALYEQGRVLHAGRFEALEREMLSFGSGSDSPDRVDALVWAVSALMLTGHGEPRLRVL